MWPETNIGVLAIVDCPCGTSGASVKLKATRYCGGDFTNGASWDEPDVTKCNFSDLARKICNVDKVGNLYAREYIYFIIKFIINYL